MLALSAPWAQQRRRRAPAPAAPSAAAWPPAAATPAARGAAKPDLAAGEAKFTAVCAACHGADGNSGTPANPKLSQQHPDYIVKQLQEFKSGKRASPIMQGFAAQLTEQDMKNIAGLPGRKKAKTGFAKDKDLVALGEQIYRGGIADRRCPPAPAATARTAPASRPSTRACPASTPTTRPASWWPSATACARTARRCRRSPPS